MAAGEAGALDEAAMHHEADEAGGDTAGKLAFYWPLSHSIPSFCHYLNCPIRPFLISSHMFSLSGYAPRGRGRGRGYHPYF